MKTAWLRILLCIITLSNSASSAAQDSIFASQRFYLHLQQHQLYTESLTWLNTAGMSLATDFRNQELARNHLRLGHTEQAYHHLRAIVRPDCEWQQKTIICGFALADTAWLQEALHRTDTCTGKQQAEQYRTSLAWLKGQNYPSPPGADPTLYFIGERNNSFVKKSPLTSAILSAAVPGLGKYYLGYKQQALSAFLINTLLAASAYELYAHGQPAYLWISAASISALFYTGTIFGSFNLAKKRNIDRKHQLYEDITQYYHQLL